MKTKYCNILIIFILIFFSEKGYSQEFRKYENEFLSLGAGARNIGMAKSSIASVSDVTAPFYNPAGLCFQPKQFQVSAMHAEYFTGLVKFDYLGVAMKVTDSSAIAFSLIRSGVDNIANTLDAFDASGNLDYDRITYFSVADYAAYLTYSLKTKIPDLSIGANAKFIFRNEGDFAHGVGFGLDAGAKYCKNSWMFGVFLQDVTTTFTVWRYNSENLKTTQTADSVQNTIPSNKTDLRSPSLNTGIYRKFSFKKNYTLAAELGLDFYFDKKHNTIVKSNFFNIDPHLGLEAAYNDLVFIRLGVGNLQKIPDFSKTSYQIQPSVGLGLFFKNLNIDYTFTNFAAGNALALYTHLFSLTYSFNTK